MENGAHNAAKTIQPIYNVLVAAAQVDVCIAMTFLLFVNIFDVKQMCNARTAKSLLGRRCRRSDLNC
eukprot:scaffold15768_cov34-Prasinocladus_malaysianus.AAC.1